MPVDLPHVNRCTVCRKSLMPRISPSKLAAFCAPNYCPRCCWRLLRMKFVKPYYFPPAGVLNHLDLHEKQLARVALANGGLPGFFGECKEATEILDCESLCWHHDDTDLHLFGKPDFVVKLKDGTYAIIDAKTAKVKLEGHGLFYSYNFQVNFYALLAMKQATPYDVSKAGLLYCEFSPMDDKEMAKSFTDEFFYPKFRPTYVAVDLDPEAIVIPVLQRVRELLDMDEAPAPRKGCCDCDLIEKYANLLSDDDELTDSVLRSLTTKERDRYIARRICRDQDEYVRLRAYAVYAIRGAADPLGSVANWDWDE
jgi:PD-(D/E)XK nuclease superfamily